VPLYAVEAIYEAVADDAAYARLPAVLAEATGSRSAIMLEFDGKFQPHGWTRHGIPDEMMARYADLGLAEHDVWIHKTGPGRFDRAVLCEEVIDADSFRQTTFYNELYRPFGDDTARCLGAVMPRRDGFMSVGLHRGYGQKRFEVAEAAALDRLLPHLRRLGEVRARLQNAEARAGQVTVALDQMSSAVLIATADGRLIYANARGEEMLRGRDGLAVTGGRIAPTGSVVVQRFAEALRSAGLRRDGHGDALRLPRGEDLTPVRVLIVPLRGRERGALIVVDDPEDPDPNMAATLSRLYGLTACEAELATLLGLGLSPSEAAEKRGVRLSTVRTQITALLHKTDSSRLADLLPTLARTPRLGGGSQAREP
jgi:DNA-binding CsgD family transcriptional regulator/PAS domain-containing protein